LDHVGRQVVEDGRVLAHGIGQRRATFDGGPDTEQGFLKAGVLLVGAENLQALHQRQASVNHDGELAEEHGNVLDLDLAAAKSGQGEFLAFLPDAAWRDALLPKLRGQPVFVGSDTLSLHFLARSGLSRKRKNWHGCFLLIRIAPAWAAGGTGCPRLFVSSLAFSLASLVCLFALVLARLPAWSATGHFPMSSFGRRSRLGDRSRAAPVHNGGAARDHF